MRRILLLASTGKVLHEWWRRSRTWIRLPTGLITELPSLVKRMFDPLDEEERTEVPVAAGVPYDAPQRRLSL